MVSQQYLKWRNLKIRRRDQISVLGLYRDTITTATMEEDLEVKTARNLVSDIATASLLVLSLVNFARVMVYVVPTESILLFAAP